MRGPPRRQSTRRAANRLENALSFGSITQNQGVLLGLLLFLARPATALDSFPAQALPGTQFGADIPNGYEPSGTVWHTGLEQLLVAFDNGYVASMPADGSSATNWRVSGDLEGITVADPTSPFIYVGVENPDSILEMNVNTGKVTRSFDLTPWMTGSSNQGLEALTFIPNSSDPEGGMFYAGLQSDGRIYSFQLPILSSSTATTVTHLGTITPVSGRNDIAGLHYDDENEVLYAVFDQSNRLRAMQADGTYLQEWTLAGNNQEGIAFVGNDLVIAEDSGHVRSYGPFPFLRRVFHHSMTSGPADFNYDDAIDAADYTTWRDTLGSATSLAADGDNNGTVDWNDYMLWRDSFGTVLSGDATTIGATVPEPSAWVLALAVSSLAVFRGHCHYRSRDA